MRYHSFPAGLALAVVSVLVFAGPAAAKAQVPFKGRLELGGAIVTPLTPPIVSVEIEGTGNATQLGQFTVSVPHLVNRSTGMLVGSYEFTAANGDTLTADFVGHFVPSGVPGVLFVVETATITGGTGRFAGATGSFTSERLVDTITGTVIGSFEGTISSPGAARR
jgi:hypothetical protein